MDIGTISIRGRVRRRDEDSILVMSEYINSDEGQQERCLLVLADGMGGAQRGEKASRIAIEAFKNSGKKLFNGDPANPVDVLQEALEEANSNIVEYARKNRINEIGTTVTAAYFDGEFLNVVNVGDSRTYILNPEIPVSKTVDDSFVMELVLSGVISENAARIHPRKNEIMRALGFDREVSSFVYKWRVFKNDSILLCCDGLWEPLSERMMLESIEVSRTAQIAVENMTYLANEMDGTDNISAILCRPGSGPEYSRFSRKQTKSKK
ncbi:MAG: protein phosphatase 2C domain-containing protein [Candidatus Thermoplasmatota archaeon]|nr:protein phosphatase 2C domain-containing protein [Candidatus Thermoplasmatota archaeon]MCL5438176.1 protein phosphatase 2C domain-containing protein [Candidatus Thermoplasmatota archaeon]